MNIREAIQQIVGDQEERNLLATVVSVDSGAKTCQVKTIADQLDIFDVRLIANDGDGIFMVPSIDSVVGISMINEIEGYVSLFSQIDSIQFGDGSNEGLIKINDLVSKLNIIESDLNDLKTAFNTWVPVPQDGGAALKSALATYISATITETTKEDLENETITHGDL